MEVVKLNSGRTALTFKAYITADIISADNPTEVIVYFDEVDQTYTISPKWNRVKEVISNFSLENPVL